MNKPITLLIVDDSQDSRQAIRAAIAYSDQIIVVGEATNGEEALELTGRLQPDVILLDVMMPRLNGIQTAVSISKLYPAIKIIMLSAYDSKELILDAVRSGAQGYLIKGSPSTEIIQAIRAVARGQAILSPLMLGWVLDELTSSANGK
ncbi:MAG: response regulator transcription factor [Anaerolineales bacterium]|nr:response regulator transcription factor [Anaerolineales bacterium]